ncbi:UvrD-helicase domain-containing protein [Candidatus Woesebacteria bacterium]|nr:UvrD-helicase domain-containing protein [Candidatus Woesebacteria bacterium]
MDANQNQKQAIEHIIGPLLIVAGAGTGKTTTLVEKIKYLILEKNVKPEKILCLTFTEKAAFEMEERVDVALPYGFFQMWISTFHSFADEILRNDIHQIGLSGDYTLMTQAQTIMFLKKHLFALNLDYYRPVSNPTKFLVGLIRHFSRLRDEDISPSDYKKWVTSMKDKGEVKNPKNEKKITGGSDKKDRTDEEKVNELEDEERKKYEELARAYATYQELKRKENVFDFDDLIDHALQLFRKRPAVLAKYQQQFAHIMVDEFQDTNIAQYELVKLLAPARSKPNLTVVGDDSQAIYKFRGASVSNIMTFMKDYPEAKQVTLNDNYRSNQTILDHAYQLIQHNNPDTLEVKLGISKELKSHTKAKEKKPVHFELFHQEEDETGWIAKKIIELKKSRYTYQDVAILVRAHAHTEAIVRALARRGIPYQILGPGMLFKQPEVKDLVAFINTLADLEDTVSFYRLLSMQYFHLPQQDLVLLLGFSKKINVSLFQAIEICLSFTHEEWYRSEYAIYKPYLPLIKQSSKDALLHLMQILKTFLEQIKKRTAGELLFTFLEETDILEAISNPKTKREEKITLNITKFFNVLKRLEGNVEDASVFGIRDYIDMSMNLGESPIVQDADVALADAVNILTVHAAKGLEFPVVIIPDLVNGRFPTYNRKEQIPLPDALIKESLPEGDFHVQEERRLFYVAITRAKDMLFLTASQLYGEGVRKRKISPFVVETMGKDLVEGKEIQTHEKKEQLSLFDFKPTEDVEPIPLPQQVRTISYSQLQSYQMCPLQYKYRYVLKIPTPANAAASYGSTIHRALQEFYKVFMRDRSVDVDTLLDYAEEYWIPVGYNDRTHEQRMKKEAQTMLKNFYESFHNKHIDVIGLEQLFKVKIDQHVYVSGKIDRVDKKENDVIEIIDYKTGKIPNEKVLKKSTQLAIYALAATDQRMYHKKVEDVDLTFYYLQGPERITMKRTKEDLIEVKKEIKDVVRKINDEEFQPRVGLWCDFCPFKMICEAWQ